MGSIWSLPGNLDDNVTKKTMTTKEDLRRLQVLQNSVMRIETASRYDASVASLLTRSKELSINQKIAFYTLNQVYNISRHKARLFGGGATGDIKTRPLTNLESIPP